MVHIGGVEVQAEVFLILPSLQPVLYFVEHEQGFPIADSGSWWAEAVGAPVRAELHRKDSPAGVAERKTRNTTTAGTSHRAACS